MPGLRIPFLTLVVLAACADAQPECACKCSKVDDDVCDFIDKQRTKVTANEEQIQKHAEIINKREVFFKDVQNSIFDVVNDLVETHINGVLKAAVDDGMPEDSTEAKEAPDTALGRTRDYLTRVLKALKYLSSEWKETAGRTEELRGRQEEAEKRWAGERRQLLARLEEAEKSSLASKNEIRQLEQTNREQREKLSAALGSDISPRLKQLEDKFNLYKDVAEIQKTLDNLISQIGRGKPNDTATVQIGEKCTDGKYPAYCEQVSKAKFCSQDYFRRICCATCTKSGQLPPD